MTVIKYGSRFTKERFLLYIAISVSFAFIAISNGTTSWFIKAWTKKDVFGDEYHGLWKICYDRPNRGFDSSCFERVGDAFTNIVRFLLCLSFLCYAIILGYIIAMQFRADLTFNPVGVVLITAALLALSGLILFLASNDIPRVHWLFINKYGYSFGVGWAGMAIAMVSGIICISLPKVQY
ncbi:uncharacterized protein cldnl12 [Hydra vulgaris]|uniref:uncharacterized protein cldnl12 n=1 Tax=Hydra vulgaris TaxID=6087 RepID=UPI001F5EC460|nr:uncharacterized protein cldnl12 [Hydra vulgaris]